MKKFYIFENPSIMEFGIVSADEDNIWTPDNEGGWTYQSIAPTRYHSAISTKGYSTLKEATEHAEQYNLAWYGGAGKIVVYCD